MRKLLVLLLTGIGGTIFGAEPLKVALYVDVGCRGGGVVHWARLLETSPDARRMLAQFQGRIVDRGQLAVGALK